MNKLEIIGMGGMIASASGIDGSTPESFFCSLMFFLFLALAYLGREDK